MNKLILASSSPRRRELLIQAQMQFEIRKQHVDESLMEVSQPEHYVQELAKAKGEAVRIEHPKEVILSADTIVSYKNEVLGKPADQKEAFDMLSMLSGKKHEVYTGVMLRSSHHQKLFAVKTTVEFWPLTEQEIAAYIASGDCFDKAGAYGIQSGGAMFVKGIAGDYYNVVGLPLSRVIRALREFDIHPS